MRFRIALYAALTVLPVAAAIVAGVWYVAANVPGWIRAEPGRVTREYRETAEAVAENPGAYEPFPARRKGWRQTGKVSGMPWGYVEDQDGGATLVWVRTGRSEWRTAKAPPASRVPYALIFYWGGGALAILAASLAALAAWSLVRFMRERDDFLAATAHDLSTPLVALRMAVGRSDEDAKNLAGRLLLIVGNIRDFLRLGGKRPPPRREPIDLEALVREAYSMFAEDYRDAFDGADVPVVSAGGPVRALGDETLVMQILWNLFGNDLKYAAPYGPVEVRISRRGGEAAVEFADLGQGMTRRQMRKAFDRYYRAKTVMESGKGGFGIGLCTSREFARSMGGELTVAPNAPRGCVFTLVLPACAPRLRESQAGRGTLPRSAGRPESQPPREARRS